VPAPYPGQGRRVYPGFLQHAGFVAMNPSRHLMSHWDFYTDLVKGDLDDANAHRHFYDEYNAVLDMPAQFYLDTIRVVFQEFLLPRGEWYVRGERVDPSAIRDTALLSIGTVHRHPGVAPQPLHRRGCRPLRHLQWSPLARSGLPEDARLLQRAVAAGCGEEEPQGSGEQRHATAPSRAALSTFGPL
jgi:hypothetical protein